MLEKCQTLFVVLACAWWPVTAVAQKRTAPRRVAEYGIMADAETIWQGVNVDFEDTLNWDNGVPGTTAADLVGVFDGSISQRSPQENLDQSASTHPFKIVTRPTFLAPVGSPGNPLIIQPTAGVCVAWFLGRGNHYIKIAGVIPVACDVVIDTQTATLEMDTESASGCYLSYMMVKSGKVTLKGSGHASYLTVNGNLAEVTVLDGAATFSPLVHLEAGKVINYRDYNGAQIENVVSAGEYWMEGLLKDTALMMTNGYFNYKPASDPSGYTPEAFLYGFAHFDVSDFGNPVPMGTVVKGVSARVSGSILDQDAGPTDYYLERDYP